MSNSSIWPIDKALSGATTPDQSGPGSDGNEGSSLFKPHHALCHIQDTCWGRGSYPSAEMQSAYSPVAADVACVYACMCIYHHHHHPHHITLVARISLTLSRHSSLSFIALGRSSGQHPVSSHSCWMYVCAGRPTFARPCVGVHKSTSLMSSSLLLQQCPACLKHVLSSDEANMIFLRRNKFIMTI